MAQVTGFLIDLDGTMYDPAGLLPGAREFYAWLCAALSAPSHKPSHSSSRRPQLSCPPRGGYMIQPSRAARARGGAHARVHMHVCKPALSRRWPRRTLLSGSP
eukprot:2807845-Prymnesium_polylepis.1